MRHRDAIINQKSHTRQGLHSGYLEPEIEPVTINAGIKYLNLVNKEPMNELTHTHTLSHKCFDGLNQSD